MTDSVGQLLGGSDDGNVIKNVTQSKNLVSEPIHHLIGLINVPSLTNEVLWVVSIMQDIMFLHSCTILGGKTS